MFSLSFLLLIIAHFTKAKILITPIYCLVSGRSVLNRESFVNKKKGKIVVIKTFCFDYPVDAFITVGDGTLP